MNTAVAHMGCRSPGLRKAALAGKRIVKVDAARRLDRIPFAEVALRGPPPRFSRIPGEQTSPA